MPPTQTPPAPLGALAVAGADPRAGAAVAMAPSGPPKRTPGQLAVDAYRSAQVDRADREKGSPQAYRRALAEAVRAQVEPDTLVAWLTAVMCGEDPNGEDGQVVTRPDWNVRMTAMRMLLERGWGLPAQHVTIEASVRAVAAIARADLAKRVGALSTKDLELLERVLAPGRVQLEAPDAIDVVGDERRGP